MEFYTLASGSSGNCSLILENGTAVLVDAGISARRIAQSLASISLTLSDLSAILITHEHSDHVSGLLTLSKKCAAPIFASPGTARALCSSISSSRILPFPVGDQRSLGALQIRSFAASHDAADPVGYRIEGMTGSLGFLTDTGFITDDARSALLGVDMLLLEANHDIETLQSGPYPYYLKRRILSEHGHLSNLAAAEFALLAASAGTSDIILAHLSRENNTPAMAEYAVGRALQSAGMSVRLSVAPREHMSEVHRCRKSPSFA